MFLISKDYYLYCLFSLCYYFYKNILDYINKQWGEAEDFCSKGIELLGKTDSIYNLLESLRLKVKIKKKLYGKNVSYYARKQENSLKIFKNMVKYRCFLKIIRSFKYVLIYIILNEGVNYEEIIEYGRSDSK